MRATLRSVLLACLMSVLVTPTADGRQSEADLVIFNANIRTMDSKRPNAEAVAVHANRITAVGTSAEVRRLAGPRTRVVDARGALLLPGFNDAHVHFISGGFQLSSVDLRDAFTPDRAVFVNRLDGHMALANSHALRLAGVTRDTPDPPGGQIVRDPKTGEPTGVLKDAAMSYVWKHAPGSSFEEKLEAARAASAHASAHGVTSVQDMSAGDDVSVYQTLLERG